MKNPGFINLLGLLFFLLLASCAMKNPSISSSTIETPTKQIKIRIQSNDVFVKSVFCDLLKRESSLEMVNCDNQVANTKNQDLTIQVKLKISNSSSDYWRNMKTAIYSIGVLLNVSTSALMQFDITFIENDKSSASLNLKSIGRIGVWGIQPVLMAVIGTTFGTFLNNDKLPNRLAVKCRHLKLDETVAVTTNCHAYKRLIENGIFKVWDRVLEKLNNLNCDT